MDLAIAFSSLFNQFDQAGDLWFGTRLQQMIELIFRQIVFQILHHIEVLPPAIQNLKTGLLVVTADFTIIERYGIAQSWATPYQTVLVSTHNGSLNELIRF
jgi:hypothetical protein